MAPREPSRSARARPRARPGPARATGGPAAPARPPHRRRTAPAPCAPPPPAPRRPCCSPPGTPKPRSAPSGWRGRRGSAPACSRVGTRLARLAKGLCPAGFARRRAAMGRMANSRAAAGAADRGAAAGGSPTAPPPALTSTAGGVSAGGVGWVGARVDEAGVNHPLYPASRPAEKTCRTGAAARRRGPAPGRSARGRSPTIQSLAAAGRSC